MSEYTLGVDTSTPSGAFATQNGAAKVDVDNIRRTFGISDKVAQLAPQESIFFSYLSKLGKKATDETVWKPLEYRNQWQRRNFKVMAAKVTGGNGSNITNKIDCADGGTLTHLLFWCEYVKYG